jgi:hypothetical protein
MEAKLALEPLYMASIVLLPFFFIHNCLVLFCMIRKIRALQPTIVYIFFFQRGDQFSICKPMLCTPIYSLKS